MLYDIQLRLTHEYDPPAQRGRHLLRLAPTQARAGQRLATCHIEVSPTPEETGEWYDFFGNRVTDVRFKEAHARLDVQLRARVERFAQDAQGNSVALGEINAALENVRSLEAGSPHHFLGASGRTWPFSAARDFALACTDLGMRADEALLRIGEALHREMQFDATATEVDTPVEEAFARRAGVCQDISHVMIAALRGIGVPAGYVSGYLRTLPPPGQARLEGADAMHAWVRAWCGPDLGWIEYDPTNAKLAGEDHVVAAYGRDYGDVAPTIGALRGTGRQMAGHAVDVVPVQAGA